MRRVGTDPNSCQYSLAVFYLRRFMKNLPLVGLILLLVGIASAILACADIHQLWKRLFTTISLVSLGTVIGLLVISSFLGM